MPLAPSSTAEPAPETQAASGRERSGTQSISVPWADRVTTIACWGVGLICVTFAWRATEAGRFAEAVQCQALAILLFCQTRRTAIHAGTTTESTSPARDSHSQNS